MSSWRERLEPRLMYKMQQSIIFRKTKEHHKICMKEMFLEYYRPMSSGDVNKEWATNLPEKTMNKFRVHLSWVMGLSVFEWSSQQIGNQIIFCGLRLHFMLINVVDIDYLIIQNVVFVL